MVKKGGGGVSVFWLKVKKKQFFLLTPPLMMKVIIVERSDVSPVAMFFTQSDIEIRNFTWPHKLFESIIKFRFHLIGGELVHWDLLLPELSHYLNQDHQCHRPQHLLKDQDIYSVMEPWSEASSSMSLSSTTAQRSRYLSRTRAIIWTKIINVIVLNICSKIKIFIPY